MKKKQLLWLAAIFLSSILLMMNACKKEDPIELPTLSTLSVSEITETTARSGGNITKDGGGEITSKGVLWSAHDNPSLEQHLGIANDGPGTGLFISNITNLAPGTTYYVRAYAVNSAGTAYGNQITFSTTNPPVADFTGSPTSGTAPLTVSFTDHSTNNPTSWVWEFGDGTTSSQRNPSKTYSAAGTYTVKLTATNSHGSNIHTKNNYITVTTGNGSGPKDTETLVVDVLNPATGKTWMDRNLGATRAATSSTDAQAYGDMYQWGRAADGHQKRNPLSGTTTTLSNNSDTPDHGNFILAPNSPYDWRSPQNNNLWQGEGGTNNPCPSGYRLPTHAEWNAERASWSSNNAAGANASPLKLPMAGSRNRSNGSLVLVGTYGYYWGSTVNGINAWCLSFHSGVAGMASSLRAFGSSVRCLKD